MASLFHRFVSLLKPAPSRPSRIFIDASTFDPDKDCAGGDAVLILACNEEATIYERVFRAMKRSPGVVVLDQGSSDSTPYLAAQAGAVVVLQEPGQSHEAALQKAMQVAYQYSEKVQVVRS
jgi:hypothetical protein